VSVAASGVPLVLHSIGKLIMTKISESVRLTVERGIGLLTINNPPVNALSQSVREGLDQGLKDCLEEGDVRAIVIVCEGRTFIAGADIRELSGSMTGPSMHDVRDMLDESSKPVIAAVHGTVFGGGLETALCCHFRIADEATQLGLPEVKLGLLPGGGGTQRLPRLVGVQMAARMMVLGEPIRADAALSAGLVDKVVSGDLKQQAISFALTLLDEGRPSTRVRDRTVGLNEGDILPELLRSFESSVARKIRGYDAPPRILECLEAAVTLPFDEGIALEKKLFAELLAGSQSKCLKYLFFSERKAMKPPVSKPDTVQCPITSVGVIGSGTMGGGISMSMANAGLSVRLVDKDQGRLDSGMKTIRQNYARSLRNGSISEIEMEERLALIKPSLTIQDLNACDLVIEAVNEDIALKQSIFRELDCSIKESAILASNTSALDLNDIAAVTDRPETVVGLHFFAPANVMKLVEVVRGSATSPEVISNTMNLAKDIGKTPVLVGVGPGFVGNRMLWRLRDQAEALMLEGALPHQVDRVLYSFGMAMGPFQMRDLSGLDIGWSIQESRGDRIRDRLCEEGRLGQKSGAGFYDYDDNRNPSPSAVVERIVVKLAEDLNVKRRQVCDEEVLDRCLLPLINEGCRILGEGLSERGSDIDAIWANGYGFPRYRGGPMFYADTRGLADVVARLEEFHQTFGDPMWEPAPVLRQCLGSGVSLQDYNCADG
jgi:3-hydroxyacyl-CoA dehydrogenase